MDNSRIGDFGGYKYIGSCTYMHIYYLYILVLVFNKGDSKSNWATTKVIIFILGNLLPE